MALHVTVCTIKKIITDLNRALSLKPKAIVELKNWNKNGPFGKNFGRKVFDLKPFRDLDDDETVEVFKLSQKLSERKRKAITYVNQSSTALVATRPLTTV